MKWSADEQLGHRCCCSCLRERALRVSVDVLLQSAAYVRIWYTAGCFRWSVPWIREKESLACFVRHWNMCQYIWVDLYFLLHIRGNVFARGTVAPLPAPSIYICEAEPDAMEAAIAAGSLENLPAENTLGRLAVHIRCQKCSEKLWEGRPDAGWAVQRSQVSFAYQVLTLSWPCCSSRDRAKLRLLKLTWHLYA